ncbi:MAG: NAD(P)-dependent oxidoreductase [Rhizomicrobium sp.]
MANAEVGFIGLGNMGGAIVRRMLKTGVAVTVFDIDAETMRAFVAAGATAASSVKDVADRASLVLVCLPTGGFPGIAREAVQGGALQVYGELSTMRPATMQEIEDIVSARGVALVDAPVSGGVTIAERGELSLMMAGTAEATGRVAAALKSVTAHVFHVGAKPGQAQLCKLANNAIGFTLFIASCEALVVGAAAGIAPAVLLEAVDAGRGRNSWTADKFGPHILSRTFDAGGKLGGGPKALDLYLAEAEILGMPRALVARARDVWAKIATVLDPAKDFTTIIRYFEQFAGVELRGPWPAGQPAGRA